MPQDQVFISYSHRDARWRDELETHFKPYNRTRSIISWSDQQIVPGSEWFADIQSALANSKIAVLLVTPSFLNSDFIHEHELGPLLKEAERGGVKILWIPVSTSSYEQTALKTYKSILDPSKPLAEMSKPKRDRAWVQICKEIQKAIGQINEPRRSLAAQVTAEKQRLNTEVEEVRRQHVFRAETRKNSWNDAAPKMWMPRHDLAVICKAALVVPDLLNKIKQQPWKPVLNHREGGKLLSKIIPRLLLSVPELRQMR